LEGTRDESEQIDISWAKKQAQKLYKAADGSFWSGADLPGFLDVLVRNGPMQLRAIFDQFQLNYGKSIEEIVKEKLSGGKQTDVMSLGCFSSSKLDLF